MQSAQSLEVLEGADATTGALPPIVLKCPECSFMCASNNQMCRHMFMTYHCLAKCAECDMRLLIWTYCPGVVKMLHRSKKDGLISIVTSVETPEKHSSRTRHSGTRGTVWTKEEFQATGVPSDYGLTALPRCGSVPTFVGFKFQCPVCSRIISTWTQMTKHLDATNHSLARCAQCDLPLKCYGTNQPGKHERLTSHRGLVGYFRVKEDYVYNAPDAPVISERQGKFFQVSCPECGVTFFHTAYLAHHMVHAHGLEVGGPSCLNLTCADCGFSGSIEDVEHHLRQAGHQGVVPDTTSELALKCVQSFGSSERNGDRRREHAVPDGSKVMYQCPECVAIFSSWTKMEKHIFYLKHSLPKCGQCGVYLRPRGWNSPEDHTAITGHQGLIGEVRKKFEYEVTVDVNDAELIELIDDPSGLPPKISQDDGDAHLVFQCPLEECLHVCLSWVLLEKHFTENHHAHVTCAVCKEELTPWRPRFAEDHLATKGHAFQSTDDTPPRTLIEEYQVTITDSELLKYYGDRFKQCAECGQVLDANMMIAHMGTRRCLKNQERHRHDAQTREGKEIAVAVNKQGNNKQPKGNNRQVAAPAPVCMGLLAPPLPPGLKNVIVAVSPPNRQPPGQEVNFVFMMMACLQMPISPQHDPAFALASENPFSVNDVVTAMLSFIQCSPDVPSAVLRVCWLLEPLTRVMDPTIVPYVKGIVVAHYQHLPWNTRRLECVQCIIHVSRVFDPNVDRMTIIGLQQYLNERCMTQPPQQQHGPPTPMGMMPFTFSS